MTPLMKNVTRLLPTETFKGRNICFRASREGVYVKLSGTHWKTAYLVSWSAIWSLGAQNKAKQIVAERKQKRKTRFLVNRSLL